MKYRKKPVVIEAMQLTRETRPEVAEWLAFHGAPVSWDQDGTLRIHTLEGGHRAPLDERNFIIKGVAGEFYPCKDAIFQATYEPVEDGDA